MIAVQYAYTMEAMSSKVKWCNVITRSLGSRLHSAVLPSNILESSAAAAPNFKDGTCKFEAWIIQTIVYSMIFFYCTIVYVCIDTLANTGSLRGRAMDRKIHT